MAESTLTVLENSPDVIALGADGVAGGNTIDEGASVRRFPLAWTLSSEDDLTTPLR